jgi:hypothetical protein
MELHQFRTDGDIDIDELRTLDMDGAKTTALAIVADSKLTGVYRIQFRDAQYDRTCWDTDDLPVAPPVGAVVFAGAS